MSAHPYAAAPPNPALVYDMADAYQQTSALEAAIDLDLRSPRPRLTVGSSRGLAQQATLKGYLRRFAFAHCKIACGPSLVATCDWQEAYNPATIDTRI